MRNVARMLDEFRSISRFRVPFGDFDLLKHANNVAYVRWCETLRCEYMADILREAIDGARGWIMAKQSFDYLAQISYMEEIAVGARISRIGTKSLDMDYAVVRVAQNALALTGTSVLVAYDFEGNHSIAVPDVWRERIRAHEVTPPKE